MSPVLLLTDQISDQFLTLLLLSSEDELPAPTNLEEKVKVEVMLGLCRVVRCVHQLLSLLVIAAEAAGDREGGEVAEDGEEVGEIQEQRQGESTRQIPASSPKHGG